MSPFSTPPVSSQPPPGSAPRQWLWQVTGLALFLGALLGTTLRAQQNFRSQNIPTSRYGVPMAAYATQTKRNDDLETEVKDLQKDKARLETLAAHRSDSDKEFQALNQDLQKTKAFAGLSPLSGPGVVVTLSDAPKDKVDLTHYAPEEFIIHDMDIFNIVNELRAAGAEAVAINDQRLIGTSPIRCEGPTVRVNYTEVGVPLEIKAIGDPKALSSGLSMTGGVLDPTKSTLAAFGMVKVSQPAAITIPAFAGKTTFDRAKPGA